MPRERCRDAVRVRPAALERAERVDHRSRIPAVALRGHRQRLVEGSAAVCAGHLQGREEPRGVAVIIAPWNFPLAILAGMTSAALVAGNCAIMKPAMPAQIVAHQLHAILLEAGFPPDVIQLLPGRGGTIGDLLVDEFIYGEVARVSREAPVLILKYDATEMVAGGAGNAANNVAALGGRTRLLGVIGAILPIPTAATIQVAIREYRTYRDEMRALAASDGDATAGQVTTPAGPASSSAAP